MWIFTPRYIKHAKLLLKGVQRFAQTTSGTSCLRQSYRKSLLCVTN